MKAIVRAAAAFLGAALFLTSTPVLAQSGSATISGQVLDQRNALPVAGAAVVLTHATAPVQRATTDGDGRYTIASVAPGVYDLTISAGGYQSSTTSDLAIANGATTLTASATLVRAETSAEGDLRTIGHVSATGRNPLAAATTITQDISVENLSRTGQIRVTDQLGALPSLNIATSASVGDDAYANIRGFGSSETQVLLDGHPIGPVGVTPRSGGFNLADTPVLGLSNVDVTYGSGAQGLYGTDTIGGSINLETLSPTGRPQYSFQQQVGGYGKSSSAFTATGTLDRLSYAFAGAVSGEYGDFHPGQFFQGNRPANVNANAVNPNGACNNVNGNDVSTCNAGVSTYAISQNTKLSSIIAKLRYGFSPGTTLTGTFYDGVQWADSTGNGDNDYVPYASRLAQIQNATSTCSTSSGVPGYTVVTNPQPATPVTACYTAEQFAAASYGGAGGGAGRQRSTSMRDYHLRFNTIAGGIHHITVDAFRNNYDYWKDSSLSGGVGINGQLLGLPVFVNKYDTQGFLIADDLYGIRNDVGIGYYAQHQDQTGNRLNGSLAFVSNPEAYFGEGSAFIRDTYRFSDQLSIFANAWVKRSSVTQRTTFDPRVTALVRPTRRDVFRFTYGRSDGAPSPSLKLLGLADATDPGASLTAVSCAGLNNVTTAGNPHLTSEAANDFEAGYGHRFKGDSTIQLNAYVTSIANQLYQASQPLLAFGRQNVMFEPGALSTYIARLNNQCGYSLNNQTVLNYLSVATTYNAAHALARGVELNGRARLNRLAYIEYGYTIESSTQSGLSDNVLMNNPLAINGAQIQGIPLHQANFSLDVAPGSWEFRLDNYYVEFNNPFNRPSYWYSNAFLSRAFGRGHTVITLGGTNIFGQASDVFGRIGAGTFAPENRFFNDGTARQQFVNGTFTAERFGLSPAQLTLTLSHRM